MADPNRVAEAVAAAPTWNARVALIRQIPETFGTAEHAAVYAAVALRAYVPSVKAEFAYIHWRPEYELSAIDGPYRLALEATRGFHDVSDADLAALFDKHPGTLRVFRLIVGFTIQEFAECCTLLAEQRGADPVGRGAIQAMENGRLPNNQMPRICAAAIDGVMTGQLFPPKAPDSPLRSKLQRPDTTAGWKSVRRFAAQGVPFEILLHQRAYGGAFRQLLDATSSRRGDLLEEPVAELFSERGIPHIRTGTANQAATARRFGLTVRPAPDFVVFDPRLGTLRAILECKVASDGGTARDKAARFRSLRQEANRLGGIPVFAVLAGAGWRRTTDALGPVIRDTDGRTFTLATLPEMIQTEPFPGLIGLAAKPG